MDALLPIHHFCHSARRGTGRFRCRHHPQATVPSHQPSAGNHYRRAGPSYRSCQLAQKSAIAGPGKKVFRDIGYHIAALEGNSRGIRVSTSYYRHRWISFYANLNVAEPPCPDAVAPFIWSNTAGDLSMFVRQWQSNGIGYFLWEEKSWSNEPIDWNSEFVQHHLQLVGQWYHEDTGSMKLFKIKHS